LDVPARDLALLFRSRHPLVVCETVEEQRFESLVRAVAGDLGLPVVTWSAARGLSSCHPPDEGTTNLAVALRRIRPHPSDGVWLLKDPQAHLDSASTLRELRETAQEFAGSARTLVLVCPSLPHKPELDDIEVHFDLALPTLDDLRGLVNQTLRRLTTGAERIRVELSAEDLEGLVSDLKGLTLFEAERALARVIVDDNALTGADRKAIRDTKKHFFEEGGLLDLVAAPEGLDQVGGLRRLKKWIATRRLGLLPPSAGKQPLDPPRGILLLGVQGCGKSLAAKAIAASWALPLLSLDAGRLLAPYIGESERNLHEALKRVERMAPCVLWIDELEKAFVSVRSTESDGGVSRRLLGGLLTWMQERSSQVFLVMTANSIEELPPELIRKGRVDEIFFVDLPGRATRAEIFRLHLKKRAEDPERFDLDSLAGASRGFSGAEIEQATVSALYETRAAGVPLDTGALLVAVRSTRPLSVIKAEKLASLRAWAAEHCVPADGENGD
jgi:hypothetical protein